MIVISELITPTKLVEKEYTATVVANNDPYLTKRIKVTIEGILEGPTANLPWCYAENSFDNENFEIGIVPQVGDKVLIKFPNGNCYTPHYRNTLCTKPSKFTDDYPNSWGVFDNNFKLQYNRTQQKLTIDHPSGSKIEMAQDGSTKMIDSGGATLNLKGGKVALGNGDEVVDLLSQLADLISQSQGNLGFPLSNVADFIALKGLIDAIKGNL